MVCMSGRVYHVKQGGTAGAFQAPVPAKFILFWDGVFPVPKKGDILHYVRKKIPYKIYLEEKEMPKAWYNLRADMKNKPAPLLNPGTKQPMTAAERRFSVTSLSPRT